MAGGIKGQAYIDHLYYELGTGGVGTFTVTIRYGNMEAQATILVTPPTDHNIHDQILSLGEALRKGAQSATLFSYPKKPQKLFGAPNLFSPVRVPC
jgi:NAD+--asparagine ADP-ribosyltransferase